MISDVFAIQLQKFSKEVEERPLLILFGGHPKHASVFVVEREITENAITNKFAAHVAEVFQTLHVAYFGIFWRLSTLSFHT